MKYLDFLHVNLVAGAGDCYGHTVVWGDKQVCIGIYVE